MQAVPPSKHTANGGVSTTPRTVPQNTEIVPQTRRAPVPELQPCHPLSDKHSTNGRFEEQFTTQGWYTRHRCPTL